MCGIVTLQGPHHVYQKSAMTNLPRKSDSFTGLPSGLLAVKSGPVVPRGEERGPGGLSGG